MPRKVSKKKKILPSKKQKKPVQLISLGNVFSRPIPKTKCCAGIDKTGSAFQIPFGYMDLAGTKPISSAPVTNIYNYYDKAPYTHIPLVPTTIPVSTTTVTDLLDLDYTIPAPKPTPKPMPYFDTMIIGEPTTEPISKKIFIKKPVKPIVPIVQPIEITEPSTEPINKNIIINRPTQVVEEEEEFYIFPKKKSKKKPSLPVEAPASLPVEEPLPLVEEPSASIPKPKRDYNSVEYLLNKWANLSFERKLQSGDPTANLSEEVVRIGSYKNYSKSFLRNKIKEEKRALGKSKELRK
jgi:hypothetical protein